MRLHTIILLLGIFFAPLHFSAQSCNPPTDVNHIIDTQFGSSSLHWYPPNSGCNVVYYEIEYGGYGFSPGMGSGTLISPVSCCNYGFNFLHNGDVYIRAACDCSGMNGMGDPDGIADNFSIWVQANNVVIQPPISPCSEWDDHHCGSSPLVSVDYAYQCGGIDNMLHYYGDYHDQVSEDCDGIMQFMTWRSFVAPADGEVTISVEGATYTPPYSWYYTYCESSWSDFGAVIKSDDCSADPVYCLQSFPDATEQIITGLTPGETYEIGIWANYFNHFYSSNYGGGYGYSNYPASALNLALNICQADLDCYQAQNLHVQQVEDVSVELDWQASGSQLWTLEYGPTGFTPGSGTVISGVSSPPYQLSGLDQQTEYDFYVTPADCDSLPAMSNGPHTFFTQPTMSLEEGPDDNSGYCCQGNFELDEVFDVFTYCPPVTFSYTDSIDGFGCDYNIIREITATDACGNALSQTAVFDVIDNDLPCGCDTLPNFEHGLGVHISGDWAIVAGASQGSRIYKHDGTEWQLHQEDAVSTWFQNTNDMDGEHFVSGNKVYTVQNDLWVLEQTLYSSAGDSSAGKAAIQGNEIALNMGDHLVIFEFDGNNWNEVAIFDTPFAVGMDFGGEFLATSHAGSTDTIARIYVNNAGTWTLDSYLEEIPGGDGNGRGRGISLDNGHLAIGHWYLGGVYAYEYDGNEWMEVAFMTNPYLDPSSNGYNTSFGNTIKIVGDRMFVGDNMNKVNGNFSGSVVEMQWSGSEWIPVGNIVPVDSHQNMRFGGCLDVDGDRMVVGIENTYWIGGWSYFGSGEHWFIECLNDNPDDQFTLDIAPDQTLECGDSLPAPSFILGPGWGPNDVVDVTIAGDPECNGTVTITYSIDNGVGNSATEVQTLSFEDTTPPILLTAPTDTILSCDDNFELLEPEFDDGCDKELEVTMEENQWTDQCAQFIERTWTAEDDCGNTISHTQLTSYQDLSPPEFDCPDSLVTILNSMDSVYFLPDLISGISVVDACDPAPSSWQSPIAGTQLGIGQHNIVVTANDSCGNVSECVIMQVVEIASSIQEESSLNVMLYPNPTDGLFAIELDRYNEIESIMLIDSDGRKVLTQICQRRRNQINARHLHSGVYQVILLSDVGKTIEAGSIVIE